MSPSRHLLADSYLQEHDTYYDTCSLTACILGCESIYSRVDLLDPPLGPSIPGVTGVSGQSKENHFASLILTNDAYAFR